MPKLREFGGPLIPQNCKKPGNIPCSVECNIPWYVSFHSDHRRSTVTLLHGTEAGACLWELVQAGPNTFSIALDIPCFVEGTVPDENLANLTMHIG